jgi:oxygen-independent coproporphyrinogen-3 oxidase
MNRKPGDWVKKLGLYIHIPFCRAKCNYCDFNSFPGKEAQTEPYFEALETEIGLRGAEAGAAEFDTVFIGGGTPSLAEPRHIYRLMNACRRHFTLAANAETSMEANPGTLTFEKLTAFRACGINRLSIGLQAWQDRLLKELGRIHTVGEFVENFKYARKAGFRNINVDLIFGLPGQNMNDWTETVSNIAALGPEHVSCYSLKIEEGTVFGDRLQAGLLEEPDDGLDRKMYWHAVDSLERGGYKHYEISNFARPGFECRHNLVYWRAEEYLGIGAGAHSYLNGRRYNNVNGIEDYIGRLEKGEELRENEEVIDKAGAMSEYMLLGLRLVDGVSAEDFRTRFGSEADSVFGEKLARLERRQLLERDKGGWRLTPQGLDYGNAVFMEFI